MITLNCRVFLALCINNDKRVGGIMSHVWNGQTFTSNAAYMKDFEDVKSAGAEARRIERLATKYKFGGFCFGPVTQARLFIGVAFGDYSGNTAYADIGGICITWLDVGAFNDDENSRAWLPQPECKNIGGVCKGCGGELVIGEAVIDKKSFDLFCCEDCFDERAEHRDHLQELLDSFAPESWGKGQKWCIPDRN